MPDTTDLTPPTKRGRKPARTIPTTVSERPSHAHKRKAGSSRTKGTGFMGAAIEFWSPGGFRLRISVGVGATAAAVLLHYFLG